MQHAQILINKLFATLTLLTIAVSLSAQFGTIRGHIFDKESGEPIIYGTILIKDTELGTTTDLDGFYTISNVPAGDIILVSSYIGYETVEIPATIKANDIRYKKIELDGSGVELKTVDISARREQARSEVQISKLQVSQKQIKALPSTGGDADILQYLQVLPGIISTGDQGGQLFIRGGSPVQNKIMLDGMTIYNPFHSVGSYSVFETELIKNVDVLTGGFNAEHGGRISAVIDIQTREGNKKRFAGQISGSPFMVKGLLEGPIGKYREDKKGAASFVLTGKRSIIESTSQTLYPNASVNDSIGLPFFFNDLYGKLSFVTSNGSKFNVFGFNFADEYNNPLVAKIGWENTGGGMNFNLIPKGSSLIVNGNIGFTSYSTNIQEADERPRSSDINEGFLGLDFSYYGNTYAINYGVEIKSIRTDFNFTNPFNITLKEFQNTTEFSAFAKYRKSWDKLVIEPSVRLQYYASLSELSPEPRLGIKYNITDNIRFKGAAGIYSQNLISTSNERDVVNLFTGFLSGPDERFKDFDGNDVDSKLQYAQHLIGGVEVDLMKGLTLNIEGYYKNFSQLIIVNRNKISPEDSDYATETGRAIGGDVSLRYDMPQWYIWATYSLGSVNRFDGEQTYRTVFDRRHNVNLLCSYTFGESRDWLVSARWNFGTGFPFTRTQGFYNYLPFLEGVSTPYQTENPDNVGIIFSDNRNDGLLPYYHRLDLSIQKTIEISKRLNIEITAGLSNAYDRDNIFYFDRLRYERVNQLPILPSLGIKFNF